MSVAIAPSPSLYASLLTAIAVAAPWIAAFPNEPIPAICAGAAVCASLLLLLMDSGFDEWATGLAHRVFGGRPKAEKA